MPPAHSLSGLAASIRTCAPGDPDGTCVIRQELAAALQSCDPDGDMRLALLVDARDRPVLQGASVTDSSQAEALCACLLESFSAAGDNGRAVLDDMALELLPAVAGIAGQSDTCCASMVAFFTLAASSCAPRDMLTAVLEVMDGLLDDSPGPDSLQFACNLLLMLPDLVAKLSRRKTANALECCSAAAALAKVHGQVLAGWSLHQLSLATQQHAGSRDGSGSASTAAQQTLDRLDTFLAANWQAYVEFTQQMLCQVVQQEPDPQTHATACQGLSTLVLQLLQHLTPIWPPQALRALSLQLLQGAGSAELLPSTDSVAPPAPMLSMAHRQRQQQQGSAPKQESGTGDSASAAEAAVLELLAVLQECGVKTWEQLRSEASSAAAGAGLAGLYGSCIATEDQDMLQMPQDVIQAVQLSCRWCCAMVEASDNSALCIIKGIALLQLTAAHARHLQCTSTQSNPSISPSPAPSTPASGANMGAHSSTSQEASGSCSSQQEQLQSPAPQETVRGGGASAGPHAAAGRLIPDLRPCIGLLAGVISQAPVQALRSQAALALQQVLQALPPDVCYACLEQLLLQEGPGGGHLHPEVAALLMQQVRGQLARSGTGRSCFSASSCMQLVMPWLLQSSPVGWETADALPDRANAVCAALAVVRLALLKSTPGQASGSGSGSAPTSAVTASAMQEYAEGSNPSLTEEQQLLRPALQALASAVGEALQLLQVANVVEQGAGAEQQGGGGSRAGDTRVCVPGEACGSGQAVDAWLAVSRVQDVLHRVLELM